MKYYDYVDWTRGKVLLYTDRKRTKLYKIVTKNDWEKLKRKGLIHE